MKIRFLPDSPLGLYAVVSILIVANVVNLLLTSLEADFDMWTIGLSIVGAGLAVGILYHNYYV
jgi:hypothetical protein